jgi:hypothetical protein
MNAHDHRSTRAAVVCAVVAVAVLTGLLLIFRHVAAENQFGLRVYDHGEISGLRDVLKTVQDNNIELLKLTTTSFGVIAFLVTYQQKKHVDASPAAWALLAIGLVALIGALIFALLTMETLQAMLGNNAVDLGLTALAVARYCVYGCLVVGAVGISGFALKVVLTPGTTAVPDGD